MAKYGEGDPRWIVEERPDATNVNNWHWTEKNATPWSKERLTQLLDQYKIDDENMKCTISEISKLNGEATANNRKGKLIFFYEWTIDLKWKGILSEDETVYSGSISIPNLSEENDLDDIEVTIYADANNDASNKLKNFLYNIGREQIRKQLGIYIRDLKEEYSKGIILPSKDSIAKGVVKPDAVKTFASGINKSSPPQVNNKTISVGTRLDVGTVKLKEEFQCRGSELYDALTKIEMVMVFTHGPVKLDPVKGGEFKLFGGNVEGKFLELIPCSKISQTWRLNTWPAGHFSNVTIEIEEKEDHTEFVLTQTGVPIGDVDKTKMNWKGYYIESIKKAFGFGTF